MPTIPFLEKPDGTVEILGMTCRFQSPEIAATTADFLREIAAEEQTLLDRHRYGNPTMPSFTWVVVPVAGSEDAFALTDGADKTVVWHKKQEWFTLQAAMTAALDKIRGIANLPRSQAR